MSTCCRPADRQLAAAALLCLFLASAPAMAQSSGGSAAPPAPPSSSQPAPWFQDLSFHGMVSSSFVINADHPRSGTNALRVFDVRDRTVTLDEVEFVVQRTPTANSRVGFRADVTFGGSVSRVTAAAGLFRDDSGRAGDLDIHQAFASYLAPLGHGLRIDAGKFVTHIGYEVVDGYDGFNDNHSRGLLFGFAEPVTHTGVRFTYVLSDVLTAQASFVNGWDNVVDNNTGKSVGLQLAVTPSPRIALTLNYLGGPEQAAENGHLRHLVNVIATGRVTSSLSLSGSWDYGRETAVTLADTAGGGVRNATWQGLALYAKQTLSDQFGLTLRGEWFDDPRGVRTGRPQTVRELTLTPEFRPDPRFIIRVDLRQDQSNRAVFERRDGTAATAQFTVSLNVLFVF